jgi:glycosyltransferase involved in cell wall biosynthesis
VCCVNQEDAEDLNRRYALPRAPKVVPIGVELKRFQPRSVDPGGTVVGFFGNLTWGANVDAVIWFASAVLPHIWLENPETVFRIIGPGAETLALGTEDPRIVRLGPVPQEEIVAAMRDITVGIIPVISGTGVRLKLLEMLSMGIPAVSTSLGRLGTNCEHGVHLLVADDPASFASAVMRLFSDAGLRHRLSRAGAEIAPMHSWESAYPRIWNAIESAARQEPRHSALDPAPKRMQTL